jgi:putative aldouronate transport system permease protein
MIAKKTVGGRVFDCFNYLLLTLLMLVTLYPFLYVAFASFSEASKMEVFNGFLWRPLGFSTDAYTAVFENQSIWSGYRNTMFFVLVGTVLNLLFTSQAAFVLSRKNFMLKKAITLLIVFTTPFFQQAPN